MKKIIVGALSVWIVFILQSSVFSSINIGHTVPNILIILTACWGFMEGEMSGLIIGFVCGMLMDVFYGSFMGFYALIYMNLGYLNGKFCNVFYSDDIKLPLILITTTDLIYGFVCYVFLFLLRGRFNFSYYFAHIIFPEVITTVIMTLVFYPIILFIHNKFLVERKINA